MAYKPGDYAKYHANPKAIKERALRNKNRREFEKKGLVRKGDGKEIDHKDGNPRNNGRGNLRVIGRHANRVKQ